MTEALPHRKIVRAKIARVAVVLSSGIKHTVPLNAVLLIAVTRIINRPIAGRAVRRSMDIVDPADLHHAVRVAGLMDAVVTIAIIVLLTVDRAARRSMVIVDPADLRHAVRVAGLMDAVVTIAIIVLLTVDRAARRSMDIVDPAGLRHAVRGAGLMDDVAGIAIGTSLTVARAIVRSTDIVVTVDRHHAEAVAISDAVSGDMKEWDSVVAPRLTSRLVRRSRSITELAGMAVVPR